MIKNIIKILILFFFLTNNTIGEENLMILKLKDGDVKKFTTKSTIISLKQKYD